MERDLAARLCEGSMRPTRSEACAGVERSAVACSRVHRACVARARNYVRKISVQSNSRAEDEMKIAGVEVATEHPGGLRTPVEQRPVLFRPLKMRGITARNRIMLGPMSQYLAIEGNLTDWHLVHLGQFAIGGAGIVCSEETAVEARGRRTHHCAGMYTDEHVRGYRRITEFIKQMGAVPAIQLGPAGRRGSVRGRWEGRVPLGASDVAQGRSPWTTVSSSAIPHGPGRPAPIALDPQEIKDEVAAWRDAARRAADAGFDALEIH